MGSCSSRGGIVVDEHPGKGHGHGHGSRPGSAGSHHSGKSDHGHGPPGELPCKNFTSIEFSLVRKRNIELQRKIQTGKLQKNKVINRISSRQSRRQK